MLGVKVRTFNERVRGGWITPIWTDGECRYSGFAIARLLGWPLSDDPRDYMPRTPEITPNQVVDRLLERAAGGERERAAEKSEQCRF